MQHKRIPYAEFYDYGRLEKAAHDLHWEETEENEILLINLHNNLVWKEVKKPMSLNEILASGGALLLFLTLVQITPIKVNPWSAVGKIIGNGIRAIGKSMNKDVMDKLESVQKELKDLGEKHNKLERRMDKDDADECRTRILRFADELRRDVKHSEEFFNQILDDISHYKLYCSDHPEYKNDKAVNAIAKIEKVYQKCMDEDSFL